MKRCVLSLLMVLACASCRPDPPPRQVIFILLDAARADRISAYGYSRPTTPNLDRLAANGLLFRNHFTHGNDTRQTMPQILFSRYFVPPIFPHHGTLPLKSPDDLFRDVDAEARSLPAILSDAGLRTIGISAHLWIQNGTPFAEEFDEFLDVAPDPDEETLPYGTAEAVVDAALEILEENRDRDLFLYLHLMDTHFPHFFREDARHLLGRDAALPPGMTPGGRPRGAEQPATEAQREYIDAIYDGSLAYTDGEIGRILEYLENEERLEHTLIAVTSDHGDHLMEVTGRFEHGGPWLDAIAHVPWIVSFPSRVSPRVVDALTEAVDVLPTILAILDLPVPPGLRPDGENASAEQYPLDGPSFAPAGVRDRRFKVVFEPEAPSLRGDGPLLLSDIGGQLYDLEADPLEEVDLWAEKPEVVTTLLNAYRSRMRMPYERYLATENTAQPSRAFVIAATHFQLHESTLRAPPGLSKVECEALGADWFWEAIWWDQLVLTGPRAAEGWIRFPVPDGAYRLRVAIRGTGWIRIPGQASEVRLEGPPLAGSATVELAGGTEEVDLGITEISDSIFQASIRPEPGSCLLIRYFAFAPLNVDSEMSEEDRERLRSLGYLN